MARPGPARVRWWLLGPASGLAYLALVEPGRAGWYPSCPFFLATGHFCPGCGALRACHALLNGRPVEAMSDNLLVVLAVPVLIGLWAMRGRVRAPESTPAWLWVVLIGVLALGFGVLRNIPALAWLAP